MLNFPPIPKIPLPLYQKFTKPSLPLSSLSLSNSHEISIKPTVLYNFLVKIIVSYLHCFCEFVNIKGNIYFESFWRRKTMGNEILHFVLGIICLHFFLAILNRSEPILVYFLGFFERFRYLCFSGFSAIFLLDSSSITVRWYVEEGLCKSSM